MQDLNVLDKIRVLIYRYHEKGLEIFLVDPVLAEDKSVWKLPQGEWEKNSVSSLSKVNPEKFIELDPVQDNENNIHHTIAVEGDWHDIPSIRGMIKHDLKRVTNKIKDTLPDLEKGTFVAAKDVIKKVLPHEYQAIRELKDILMDRNSITNI